MLDACLPVPKSPPVQVKNGKNAVGGAYGPTPNQRRQNELDSVKQHLTMNVNERYCL